MAFSRIEVMGGVIDLYNGARISLDKFVICSYFKMSEINGISLMLCFADDLPDGKLEEIPNVIHIIGYDGNEYTFYVYKNSIYNYYKNIYIANYIQKIEVLTGDTESGRLLT